MAYEVSRLKQVLRHHLTADPALFALVRGQVFSGHGRDTEEASRVGPLVIVDFRGGIESEMAPVARRTFHLWAYSTEGPDHAGRVYEAAKVVLRRKGLGAPLDEAGDPCFAQCGYFIPGADELHGWNEVLGANYVRGTWQGWTFG